MPYRKFIFTLMSCGDDEDDNVTNESISQNLLGSWIPYHYSMKGEIYDKDKNEVFSTFDFEGSLGEAASKTVIWGSFHTNYYLLIGDTKCAEGLMFRYSSITYYSYESQYDTWKPSSIYEGVVYNIINNKMNIIDKYGEISYSAYIKKISNDELILEARYSDWGRYELDHYGLNDNTSIRIKYKRLQTGL